MPRTFYCSQQQGIYIYAHINSNFSNHFILSHVVPVHYSTKLPLHATFTSAKALSGLCFCCFIFTFWHSYRSLEDWNLIKIELRPVLPIEDTIFLAVPPCRQRPVKHRVVFSCRCAMHVFFTTRPKMPVSRATQCGSEVNALGNCCYFLSEQLHFLL